MCGGGGGDNDVPETAEERALAQTAAKQWNWTQEHVRPLVDDYIQQVDATEGDYAAARGEAGMAGRQSFSDAKGEYRDASARRGVNPNSGAWAGGVTGLSEDEAASTAGGMTKAGFGVLQDQDRQKMGMLQYGSGKAATAMEGMGREAEQAASDAISEAANSFNERAAWRDAAGTAAGVGVRAYEQPSQKSMSLGGYGVRGEDLPIENINDGTWKNPGPAFR